MKKEIRTLILYRSNRADESLEEALILLERDHINTFAFLKDFPLLNIAV